MSYPVTNCCSVTCYNYLMLCYRNPGVGISARYSPAASRLNSDVSSLHNVHSCPSSSSPMAVPNSLRKVDATRSASPGCGRYNLHFCLIFFYCCVLYITYYIVSCIWYTGNTVNQTFIREWKNFARFVRASSSRKIFRCKPAFFVWSLQHEILLVKISHPEPVYRQ